MGRSATLCSFDSCKLPTRLRGPSGVHDVADSCRRARCWWLLPLRDRRPNHQIQRYNTDTASSVTTTHFSASASKRGLASTAAPFSSTPLELLALPSACNRPMPAKLICRLCPLGLCVKLGARGRFLPRALPPRIGRS